MWIFAALVSEETPRRVKSEWITLLVLGHIRCRFGRHSELIVSESDHKRFPGGDVGGTPDDPPVEGLHDGITAAEGGGRGQRDQPAPDVADIVRRTLKPGSEAAPGTFGQGDDGLLPAADLLQRIRQRWP